MSRSLFFWQLKFRRNPLFQNLHFLRFIYFLISFLDLGVFRCFFTANVSKPIFLCLFLFTILNYILAWIAIFFRNNVAHFLEMHTSCLVCLIIMIMPPHVHIRKFRSAQHNLLSTTSHFLASEQIFQPVDHTFLFFQSLFQFFFGLALLMQLFLLLFDHLAVVVFARDYLICRSMPKISNFLIAA